MQQVLGFSFKLISVDEHTMNLIVVLCFALHLIFFEYASATGRSWKIERNSPSFNVDYENDQFLLDGKPFRYIAGDLHYFRIHKDLWEDRLKKVRALGLNVIQTYVPWNFHETQEGQFHFTGQRDIIRFIKIAEKFGMYTILRIGPYICSEWENGGLPWWLLKKEGIVQRTSDEKFTKAVERWFNELLKVVKPHLRKNGGPILMLQIENEYGSYYACDRNYTHWLRDFTKSVVGSDVQLYTTDGGSEYYMKCGPIDGVFPTVDFGPQPDKDIEAAFAVQRNHSKHGPLVNSEFYPGWLILWGQKSKINVPTTEMLISSSRKMYSMGASFVYYVIHGGTNFGFWNGAEPNAPVLTSYDFFAPISEAGDITPNYIAIRNWIKSLTDWPQKPQSIPGNSNKIAYGNVKLEHVMNLNELPSNGCVESETPLSFEVMNHGYGFMVYTTKLQHGGSTLTLPSYKDFAYIYVDDKYKDTLYWLDKRNSTNLGATKAGQTLTIIVENQGRQTYETINDYKGILSEVLLDGKPIKPWTICTINMFRNLERAAVEAQQRRRGQQNEQKIFQGVFMGVFEASEPADTFIDFSNWGKGVIMVNGKNMGRYWNVGPQFTLYVPSPIIRKGKNRIVLIELNPKHFGCQSAHNCTLPLIDKPIWKWEKPEFSKLGTIPFRH